MVPELSTRRVVTSDLADGVPFAEVTTWSQAERDLTAETIYRFAFGGLYGATRSTATRTPATTCSTPAVA